jgi:hypothetical protein
VTTVITFRLPRVQRGLKRGRCFIGWLCPLLLASAAPAFGAGPTVLVATDSAVDAKHFHVIRDLVHRFRSVAEEVPLSSPSAASADEVALEQRAQAVQMALERARKSESEALWDDCVRESARVMSDAIELIGATGELRLLRDLHVEMGVCMSLSDQPVGARLHFLAAALLDERPLPTGLHREEAERVEAEAREEILARPRGKVRILSEPPGAEVLIDGHVVDGVTPIETDVRLGDHFVTFRRFRFEPNTEQRFLQPLGLLRVKLEPAHRSTLNAQLARIERHQAAVASDEELLLAKAVLARAEQLLLVSNGPAPTDSYRLTLLDAPTGQVIRASTLEGSADDAATKRMVCEVLGEECTVSVGAPWYVWPLAGAVLVAGIITTVVIAENGRDTRFCPPSGCR